MKRHTVIVAIHAKHSDLEISQFINVSWSFVHKVRRKLEASDVWTPHFVQQIQDIIDEYSSKFIRAISRDLQLSECVIRCIIHEDIRYKFYGMLRGQFMSAETR